MYNVNMKVELMGASFDPPHNGRLEIASSLLSKNIADEI